MKWCLTYDNSLTQQPHVSAINKFNVDKKSQDDCTNLFSFNMIKRMQNVSQDSLLYVFRNNLLEAISARFKRACAPSSSSFFVDKIKFLEETGDPLDIFGALDISLGGLASSLLLSSDQCCPSSSDVTLGLHSCWFRQAL